MRPLARVRPVDRSRPVEQRWKASLASTCGAQAGQVLVVVLRVPVSAAGLFSFGDEPVVELSQRDRRLVLVDDLGGAADDRIPSFTTCRNPDVPPSSLSKLRPPSGAWDAGRRQHQVESLRSRTGGRFGPCAQTTPPTTTHLTLNHAGVRLVRLPARQAGVHDLETEPKLRPTPSPSRRLPARRRAGRRSRDQRRGTRRPRPHRPSPVGGAADR